VVLWTDRLEDDGAAGTSETALCRIADRVVRHAVQGLRRAFVGGDLHQQWRAQVLLELARFLRVDLHGGGWARLAAGDRRQLRRALLMLSMLAHSAAPFPVA
jgi:hypothetical protein